MSKLNLIRTALRSNFTVRQVGASHGRQLLLCKSEQQRLLSTEPEQPPWAPEINLFLRTSEKGLVYGKLFGVTSQTLKTDVLNLLEGCELTLHDLKVEYNRIFNPMGVMVQFPSQDAFDRAIRVINKKGRLHRLERVNRSQWESLVPYNGKTVLLRGLPISATANDVERFLTGFEYLPSLEIFFRAGFPDAIKMATVRFPSQTGAMNLFIKKNRSFCLNNQVLVRVLQ